MDWTHGHVEELARLWNDGLSTLDIGKRFDITKNAVVGKVNRLRAAELRRPGNTTGSTRFPERPSPQGLKRHVKKKDAVVAPPQEQKVDELAE